MQWGKPPIPAVHTRYVSRLPVIDKLCLVDLITDLDIALWPLDHPRDRIPIHSFRPAGADVPRLAAAVLIPIIMRQNGPTILFTHRSEALSSHAGQVSFPGGKVEPEDQDAIAAALRESNEEVGIDSKWVQPVGLLDFHDTITDFRILPVVGLVDDQVVIEADHREVAAVFEVSLKELKSEERYELHTASILGQEHQYHSFQHEDYLIWGATAAILRDLIKRF